MSSLDHILLFSYLFFLFFSISNKKQTFITKHFWLWALLPIISYSLIVGMRYGWGADYKWYKGRFENPNIYGNESPGFYFLNVMMNDCGFDYVMAYITYSILLIVGACILIRDFDHNKYMLTLFLPATLIFTTAIIRQGVALSFTYVMLYALQNKRWFCFLAMGCITYSIHPGALVYLTPSILFFFLYKGHLLPLQITVPSYIICSLSSNLFKDFIANPLSNLISSLAFGNIAFMNEYAKRADEWFGAKAIIQDWYQEPLTLMLSMIFELSIIIMGFIALKNKMDNKVAYLYNTVVTGYILSRLFFPVELMHRFTDPMYMLYFIPFGYAIYQYQYNKSSWTVKERQTGRFLLISSMMFYLIPYFLRFIFLNPLSDFVWNHPT